MQSMTYKDIIDDKIAEWKNNLKNLEKQASKGGSDYHANLNSKIEHLRLAMDRAIVQLHSLDGQETVSNTMETKDKILKIFSSIDKDFPEYEDKAPFML
jgi:hypothetical protein